MVPHREGDIERYVSSGKNNSEKSEATHCGRAGGSDMKEPTTKSTNGEPKRHKYFLCILCLFVGVPSSFAQAIYAENRVPARGVSVEYTVTIKNPTSHVYDVEIQIKGIREPSLSVSMPALSPGIYRIENYARNIQDFRATNTRNQVF